MNQPVTTRLLHLSTAMLLVLGGCSTEPPASSTLATGEASSRGGRSAALSEADCSDQPCPPPPPPSLGAILPTLARAGTQITLTGTGFVPGSVGQIGPVPCTTTSFDSSTALTCTVPSVADGIHAVSVTNPDGQTSLLSDALTFDGTPPTGGGTLQHDTFVKSLTSSPVLRWSAFSDAQSGLEHYEYAIGTREGETDTRAWTPFIPSNGPSTVITGLALSEGAAYFPSVRAYDRAGNVTTLLGSAWVTDTVGPTAPTGLTDGGFTLLLSLSPTASWTASTDLGSGVASYELAIGTSPGATDGFPWTPIGNVTSAFRSDLKLAVGTTYFTSVRASDQLGNVGAVASGDGWVTRLASPSTLVFLPMDHTTAVAGDNSSAEFVNFANAGASFRPVLAPAISTVSPRFGAGSGSFKNGYLKTPSSVANVIGHSDFTIEFWVKYSGSLESAYSTVVSGSGWDISLGNTNYNNAADFSYGNQFARWWGGAVGWGVLPKGTWSHLSISRSGTSLYTHLNGVLKETATLPAGARLEGDAIVSSLTVGNFAPAYLDDLLITVGAARHSTANFTPTQVTGLPSIYLPMDAPSGGENVSADFRNTVVGGVALSPSGSPTLSSAAGCDGCGDFRSGSLSTTVASTNVMGTRDFTIEFWVNHNSLGVGGSPVLMGGNASGAFWDISLGNTHYNGEANFAFYTTEVSGYRHWGGDIGWGVLPLNTWTHLSLTRLGTTLITHKNGALVETKTILATDKMEGPNTTSAFTIGAYPAYLDDLMITVGKARHTTASFPVERAANAPRVVETQPYVFLPLDGVNGSAVFPNLAASGVTFSAVSAPVLTTSTSRFGGASGKFHGGSLTTAATAANVIGTRDFTIELWVNFAAYGGAGTPVISGNGWDISLGNTYYNNSADFAYGNQPTRWWGGSVGWGVLPLNTWVHLAISRSQDRLYTHKNGVLVSTVEIPSNAHLEAGAATSALKLGESASYLDDVMITVGSAKYSTAHFTVAQLAKPFMYLPMDGANLSTSFPNYGTGPGVSNVASPTLTTLSAVHGGASANLTAGSLTTATSPAYRLGTQDFTIEFWVNNSVLGAGGSPVITGNGWDISLGNSRYNNEANFAYYVTQNSGYRHWGGDIGWGVLPLNTWVHLSLSRSGTRLYTHKNGVLVSAVTIPANSVMEGPNTTSAITVGAHPAYVDDLLVTMGKVRHTTANFAVYP
ncbi:IPT/TIG domain-containing protein [Stigmatella sp. ncwal1]|uniref:IPT/TIG domain-containing protein n=1 Tax=Stigmatella ashevillensis TaxID=2995309 RepID=A0ABT5DEF8_9BACT|nr:LamG-like jellyroll fold domain-containing protein [Stigmatella ashevillena]MDC0711891.1 IPT/TIG domain-containing protein [Stigmatella ashevillena]